MWFDKKTRPAPEPLSARSEAAPPAPPEVKTPMSEPTPKPTYASGSGTPQTVLGRTMVAQGQLAASEDLLIDGKFDGTINLDDHCLTVGKDGQVKAEVRARQVVIQGTIHGNVVAREKVEIRRTGHVVGDLVAGTVAIEEGAYFKGSIDIAREEGPEAGGHLATSGALKTSV